MLSGLLSVSSEELVDLAETFFFFGGGGRSSNPLLKYTESLQNRPYQIAKQQLQAAKQRVVTQATLCREKKTTTTTQYAKKVLGKQNQSIK